jgi:hypothetical protein
MPRKPWIDRDGPTASCSRCGATSSYRVLSEWRASCTGRPRKFDYWYWWKEFKRHHKKCSQRIKCKQRIET